MLNSNPKFLSPVVWCATNELVYLPGALALTVGSHLDLAARLRLHPDIQRIKCTALYDNITIQPECLQPVMWIPMCCVEMHRIIRPLLCDIRIVGQNELIKLGSCNNNELYILLLILNSISAVT